MEVTVEHDVEEEMETTCSYIRDSSPWAHRILVWGEKEYPSIPERNLVQHANHHG